MLATDLHCDTDILSGASPGTNFSRRSSATDHHYGAQDITYHKSQRSQFMSVVRDRPPLRLENRFVEQNPVTLSRRSFVIDHHCDYINGVYWELRQAGLKSVVVADHHCDIGGAIPVTVRTRALTPVVRDRPLLRLEAGRARHALGLEAHAGRSRPATIGP
ncbi:hypothetical protein [Micromonospora sp. NPDC004704]